MCAPWRCSPVPATCNFEAFGPCTVHLRSSSLLPPLPHARLPGFVASTTPVCKQGYWGVMGYPPCYVCIAGTYGSGFGANSSSCDGNCTAGYACAAGSTNATAALCPAGKYSLSGAGSCTNCSAGSYGDATGLNTTACSGACPAGRYAFPGAAVCTDCGTVLFIMSSGG